MRCSSSSSRDRSAAGTAMPGVIKDQIEAALGKWKMRRAPAGQASLLAKLRRYMPSGPVDASLRKTFGLA